MKLSVRNVFKNFPIETDIYESRKVIKLIVSIERNGMRIFLTPYEALIPRESKLSENASKIEYIKKSITVSPHNKFIFYSIVNICIF